MSIVSSVITYHSRHKAGTVRKRANGTSRFALSNLPWTPHAIHAKRGTQAHEEGGACAWVACKLFGCRTPTSYETAHLPIPNTDTSNHCMLYFS